MSELFGKQQIYDLLAERNIPYEKLEHEAVFTMEEMDLAGITSKGTVCKNLFLRDNSGKHHFLLTVPEETHVDLKAVARKINSSRLSFASADRLEKYLGVTQGSVSPLGILNDEERAVQVIFHECLKPDPAIGVHPNDNTATLWLRFSDLYQILAEHGNQVRFVSFDD